MRGLRAALIAMMCVLLGLLPVGCSCGDDDDDDSGSPPDDDSDDDSDDDDDDDADDEADDDADDDDADDDADDDDVDDDEDYAVDEFAPVLSDANFDPNPTTRHTALHFNVCDEEDDLSGGIITIWPGDDHGWRLTIPWDDFEGGAPHAPDCNSPTDVGIEFDFAGYEPGFYSYDVKATDGKGHRSNMLEDVTVEVIES